MKKNNNKGITLIALVITIIVLIILTGISINMLFGDNGIIKKAQDASTAQEKVELIEEIQLKISDKTIDNKGGISKEQIEDILDDYGTIVYESEEITGFRPIDKDYVIPYEKIYTGGYKNVNSNVNMMTLKVFLDQANNSTSANSDDSILDIEYNGEVLYHMTSYENPEYAYLSEGNLSVYRTTYIINVPKDAVLHFYCSTGRKSNWEGTGINYTSRTHLYYTIVEGSGTYQAFMGSGVWSSDHDWYRSTWITDEETNAAPTITYTES